MQRAILWSEVQKRGRENCEIYSIILRYIEIEFQTTLQWDMTGFPVEILARLCKIFCTLLQTTLQRVRIHDTALQASRSAITPTEGQFVLRLCVMYQQSSLQLCSKSGGAEFPSWAISNSSSVSIVISTTNIVTTAALLDSLACPYVVILMDACLVDTSNLIIFILVLLLPYLSSSSLHCCTPRPPLPVFFPHPSASSSGLPCIALESQPVTEAVR